MSAEARRFALGRGAEAEAHVANALAAQGWSVLARNWRGEGGELDLVVSRDGVLRFVEVKAREGERFDDDELVPIGKRLKLISAADAFLAGWAESPKEACFLLAVVDLTVEPWPIRWLDDPFDG